MLGHALDSILSMNKRKIYRVFTTPQAGIQIEVVTRVVASDRSIVEEVFPAPTSRIEEESAIDIRDAGNKLIDIDPLNIFNVSKRRRRLLSLVRLMSTPYPEQHI